MWSQFFSQVACGDVLGVLHSPGCNREGIMSQAVGQRTSDFDPLGATASQWFVIQTNPREEDRGFLHLTEKGFEVFFPRIRVLRYRQLRVGHAIRPLFPSYLFARFKYPEEYPQVLWTRGVRRVLGADLKPTAVPDEVIATIQSQMDPNGLVRVGRRLRPRDPVRIKSGPFKDLLGIFERELDEDGRVEILLQVLGFQARVHLHESMLEKVP